MNKRCSAPSLSKKLVRVLTAVVMLLIGQAAYSATQTLESVLRTDPAFSLFTKAMDISHFWESLAKEDSVTLLIPTDKAMEAEGSDFLLRSVLMARENRDRLVQLVLSHATTDRVILDTASNSADIRTLSDDCLRITRINNAIKVGPEDFVLSSLKIGKNQLFTIDRLLILHYQSALQCVGNAPFVSSK